LTNNQIRRSTVREFRRVAPSKDAIVHRIRNVKMRRSAAVDRDANRIGETSGVKQIDT
jgi:hypothetical protein